MSTEDYSFSEISGGYRIGTLGSETTCSGVPTGYKSVSKNKEPVSPSKFNGKDILEIGRCAYSYIAITKVTISEPTMMIQCYAFDRCTSLTEVYLPPTITYVANAAFQNCNSLAHIFLCRKEAITYGANPFAGSVPNTLVISVPMKSSITSLGSRSTQKTLSMSCFSNSKYANKRCTCVKKRGLLHNAVSLIYQIMVFS